MNVRLLTATVFASTLLTAFAVPALAQEATPDGFTNVTSSTSRDAVRGNAIAALKAGQIESGEASYSVARFESTLSRAQVAAEGREALRLGVVAFGEGPAPVTTPAQAEAIRMAGLQAIGQTVAQATR